MHRPNSIRLGACDFFFKIFTTDLCQRLHEGSFDDNVALHVHNWYSSSFRPPVWRKQTSGFTASTAISRSALVEQRCCVAPADSATSKTDRSTSETRDQWSHYCDNTTSWFLVATITSSGRTDLVRRIIFDILRLSATKNASKTLLECYSLFSESRDACVSGCGAVHVILNMSINPESRWWATSHQSAWKVLPVSKTAVDVTSTRTLRFQPGQQIWIATATGA